MIDKNIFSMKMLLLLNQNILWESAEVLRKGFKHFK